MDMPPRPMPPMGDAPNTPPMGMPPTGGAVPPPVNPPVNRLDSLMNTAGPVTGMGGPSPMPEDPMIGEDPMMEGDPMEIASNMAPEELASGVANSVLTASNSPEEALAIVESAADELRALVQQGSGQDAGRIEDMLAGLV